jgi:beta-galactosidase
MSTMTQSLPAFPFGAVYYRKANPPGADWERDYRTAAEDGMNAFRHWFLWSAIETAHGVFDWEDYDRHFDLAKRYGLKTIIAEHLYTPEWAFHEYAHAHIEDREGRKPFGKMNASCGAGGTAGLCLDHADARLLAEEFLKQMVLRYKNHPGMGGYDIWNECNYTHQSACYCDATAEKLRTWLKNKYGDVRSVGQAWRRFSFSEWEHVTPPRQVGPYPDTLDWLQFRLENAYELMQWRVDLVRRFDSVRCRRWATLSEVTLALPMKRSPAITRPVMRSAAAIMRGMARRSSVVWLPNWILRGLPSVRKTTRAGT